MLRMTFLWCVLSPYILFFDKVEGIARHGDPKTISNEPLIAGSGKIPWWAWVLLALLGCVIVYFVVYAMCCNSESGEEVRCYLCDKNIGGYHWKNGSHRKFCADKNVIFLNSLPTGTKVPCPICGKCLRQWPVKLVAPFSCNGGSKCPNSGVLLPNTGENRFNCFPCDYDLCKDCMTRMRGITSRRRNGWVDQNGGMLFLEDDDRAKLLGGGRPKSLYIKTKLNHRRINDEELGGCERVSPSSSSVHSRNVIENPTYYFNSAAFSDNPHPSSPSKGLYSEENVCPPPLVLTSRDISNDVIFTQKELHAKKPPYSSNVILISDESSHPKVTTRPCLAYLPSQSPKQTLL